MPQAKRYITYAPNFTNFTYNVDFLKTDHAKNILNLLEFLFKDIICILVAYEI